MNHIGQCKCGEIAFDYSNDAARVVNCHCDMCKQMNGSAFSTYVAIPSQHLAFKRGEPALASYAISEQASKHFCRRCGTALFNTNPVDYPGLRMLYLGTLSNFKEYVPLLNIYCQSKLSWVDRIGDLKGTDAAPRPRQ